MVKIGMLGTPATIDTVATALEENKFKHVVLDPVLICKGQEPGAALDTDTALRAKVLPQATVVTPNNFEATTLSGLDKLETVEDLKEAARLIHEQGPQYVVVKGGMDFPARTPWMCFSTDPPTTSSLNQRLVKSAFLAQAAPSQQ